MDKHLRNTLLYDFYGELLTQKQREIYHMYFCDDMSLAEIGEKCGITRQAVNFSIKQAQKSLDDLDGVLELVAKNSRMNDCLVALQSGDYDSAELILKDLMEV
ncbi:MAG: DNA-binding protein [Defluviitaleaceae bacterium]|nr:DNA-binding protein [Defluviitaleaceae bacterium]